MKINYKLAYLKLNSSGLFDERIDKLYKILENCTLCPRNCRVNRLKKEKGFCGATDELVVLSIYPHFGEESELVGSGGSGTIFLSRCNLGCLYCQNYEISHLGEGQAISEKELAKNMLRLQKLGCHNINLVTPTHFSPQLVKAIKFAIELGLRLPIVYNCGGYENVETVKLLDGIVDIYMPDIKYSQKEPAEKFSKAPDYFEHAKEAVLEMYRQVGDLEVIDGIAERGLLIRHLVLPNDLAGSKKVLEFIAEEISKDAYVNIMDQYRPQFQALSYPELSRRLTEEEYNKVIEMARELGLQRGFA
ncbi:MAG: radical SAM protein [Candidatus Omnitrophota bacterium]